MNPCPQNGSLEVLSFSTLSSSLWTDFRFRDFARPMSALGAIIEIEKFENSNSVVELPGNMVVRTFADLSDLLDVELLDGELAKANSRICAFGLPDLR